VHIFAQDDNCCHLMPQGLTNHLLLRLYIHQ
jgi:hypothetical protein